MAELWVINKLFSTILVAILKIFVCEIQDLQKALGFAKTFRTNLSWAISA